MPETIVSPLSEYYTPLDLPWVHKMFTEIGRDSTTDADEFLLAAIECDPLVLASLIWPRLKFQWFHRAWVDHVIKNLKPLLLGPRGHGKSKITSFLLPAWGLINDRDLTFACVSATKEKARKWARPTKQILENKLITHLFGEFQSVNWLKMEYTVCGREPDIDDPSMQAFGTDAGATSFHPRIVIEDDVVDLKHMQYAEKRERLREFHEMTLGPAMGEETQHLVVGTRYHPEDYYGECAKAGHVVNTGTMRCFLDDPDTPVEEMTKLLWPEMFTVEYFLEKYRKGAAAFYSQQFNDIELLSGKIWRADLFRYSSEAFTGPCVLGVDTAFRTGTWNDDSTIAAVRQCAATKRLVIENCIGGKWTGDVLLRKVKEEYHHHAARGIIIENWTQNKKAMRERFFLRDMLRAEGYPVQMVRPSADKISRYFSIVPLWEAGQVIHRPGLNTLERQMLSVPGAKHDDYIDAVEIAISYLSRRARVRKTGRKIN